MKAAIVIPWRGGDPARERNLEAVLRWYAPLGLDVVYGDSDPSKEFNRGAARNAAMAKAMDRDVVLLADADTVADISVVSNAFEFAMSTGKVVLPHDDFWRTNERGARSVIANMEYFRANPKQIIKCTVWPRIDKNMMPSGAIVLTPKAFTTLGRYEEGFIGWGYEDSAFLSDAEHTVGVERLPGYLWHLYHRPSYGRMVDRRANHDLFEAREKRRESAARS